jgi:hypothetical protein
VQNQGKDLKRQNLDVNAESFQDNVGGNVCQRRIGDVVLPTQRIWHASVIVYVVIDLAGIGHDRKEFVGLPSPFHLPNLHRTDYRRSQPFIVLPKRTIEQRPPHGNTKQEKDRQR